MTTRPNPSPPDQTATAVTGTPPSVEPLTFVAPPGHGPLPPPDYPPTVGEHRDPVGDLVHTAVSDRPLEEVVRLVTLLEGFPEYAPAIAEVLRAAAVDRPVEDVALLVAELTRPPRDADSADATIRAAIESRCVDDVTRLMALLHRAPLQPHCGAEAVRAAATGRPVEELVELIGRLSENLDHAPGGAARGPDSSSAPAQETNAGHGVSPGHAATPAAGAGAAQVPRGARVQARERPSRTAGDRSGRPLFWPSWLAAAALLVCAAACFPPHRAGASPGVYGVTVGASAVCVLLAALVAFQPSTTSLAVGAVVPSLLAGVVLVEDRTRSAALSKAVELTLAPPWSAGLTAVCAALASLAALLLLLMVQMADRRPAPRPVAGQGVVTD